MRRVQPTGGSKAIHNSKSSDPHCDCPATDSVALLIGSAIAARQERQMTQKEFAALIGISHRTLQDWEQGRRRPCAAGQMLLRQVTTPAAPVDKPLSELIQMCPSHHIAR